MAQERLSELHSLDLHLSDLRSKITEAKRRVENFQQSILRRDQTRQKIASELKASQVESKGLELQIESANEKKKSLEGKLQKVIKPHEIEALQHEIQNLVNDVGTKELTLLEKYELQEKTQASMSAEEAEIKKRTAELPKLKAQVAAQIKDLETQLETNQKARDMIVTTVEPAMASRYANVRKRYPEGIVLFEILENNCGGCGFPAAGFEWNKLRQNPGNAYECSNCGRLLVYVGERLG
jgi:predicted  nucleic acid-binding Zn-ribbon protein